VTPLVLYRIVHFVGIFAMVTVLAASFTRAAASGEAPGTGAGGSAPDPWSKRFAIAHGVALVLILLGGFGMLGRLGLGFPAWAVAKLGVWVLAGGLIALRKSPSTAAWGLVIVPLLAALAGWLGYAKPF